MESGDPNRALPLDRLDHPILHKASECFGEDPAHDNPVGTIAAVRSTQLYEVKVNQWRAGVWIDSSDVCWVVVAGLAKGNHNDRDDFYKRLERLESQSVVGDLLPSDEDDRLWKLERSHALLNAWHLKNQQTITEALDSVSNGGSVRITVNAPQAAVEKGRSTVLAEIDITVARFEEPDYRADEVVLTVREQADWKGSNLAAAFTNSLLACVHPPETEWDPTGGHYSNILEIKDLRGRVAQLRSLNESGERAVPAMVSQSHYVHARNLADRIVEGRAARSLCGIYFVPRQDHERLPMCPECSAAYAEAGTSP